MIPIMLNVISALEIQRVYASKQISSKSMRVSATDLFFKGESFHLIICMELLHHFTDNVFVEILRKINDIIKLGSIFTSILYPFTFLAPYVIVFTKKED